MKHSNQCECDDCKSKLYSVSYQTKTEHNQVTSVYKKDGVWYVDYTTTFLDGSISYSGWPVETWNKYAKINQEKS